MFNLSLIQIQLKKYEDSKRNLSKLLKTSNKSDAIKYLGILHIIQNKYSEAHTYFKNFLELRPNDSMAWQLKGVSEEQQNKIEEAKISYLKALDLDKNNIDVLGDLGVLFLNNNEYQQAYTYFKKLTEIDPKNSEGWRLLGKSLFYLDKSDEAKK